MSGSSSSETLAVLKAQADEQLRNGLFEDAVEAFSACVAIEPRDAGALQGRARALFQLKRWAEASADFRAAKDADPADPESWVGLGMSLAMANQVYPAVDVLEELVATHPECVRGQIQLGLLYFQLSLVAKGRQRMQEGLAHRPTLSQRRFIESVLQEQAKLDCKRYYRPDFEALNQQPSCGVLAAVVHRVQGWLRRGPRGGSKVQCLVL